jgi:hypothetical protein
MNWASFLIGLFIWPAFAFLDVTVTGYRRSRHYLGLWALFTYGASAVIFLILHDGAAAWGSITGMALTVLFLWWDSGIRKRASKAIGGKARKVRAIMVRTLRQRRIHRPSLIPEPA